MAIGFNVLCFNRLRQRTLKPLRTNWNLNLPALVFTFFNNFYTSTRMLSVHKIRISTQSIFNKVASSVFYVCVSESYKVVLFVLGLPLLRAGENRLSFPAQTPIDTRIHILV